MVRPILSRQYLRRFEPRLGGIIEVMATEIPLSEEAESLSQVPLFKRLEPHELEKLAEEVDQVNYKAGDIIFNERDRGDALYVVETGSVRIWVRDQDVQEVTLAELKPG